MGTLILDPRIEALHSKKSHCEKRIREKARKREIDFFIDMNKSIRETDNRMA